MRVAVIGANGRIGSSLLTRFQEAGGFEPVAVCRNAMGAALVDGAGCEVRHGPIAESESARRLLGDCDVAINCKRCFKVSGERPIGRGETGPPRRPDRIRAARVATPAE